MRIASSPTLRIAAGLLAVLLGVVGYQVVRRQTSHGPEALLKRADDVLWLVDAVQTEAFYLSTEQKLHLLSEVAHLMAVSAPLFAVIKGSLPSPSHDSIVDLLLAPVLVWRQSTLSRRPVSSQ